MSDKDDIRQHAVLLSSALDDDDWMEIRLAVRHLGTVGEHFKTYVGYDGLMEQIAKTQLSTGAISTEPNHILTAALHYLESYDRKHNPEYRQPPSP